MTMKINEDCIACGGQLSNLEIDVEDLASILFRYKDFSVSLHMDYIQAPPSRNCKVIGTAGKIELNFTEQKITHYNSVGDVQGNWDYSDFPRNELFIQELKHFMDCLENREKTLIPVSEGVQSLKMALAATESLNSDCFRKI